MKKLPFVTLAVLAAAVLTFSGCQKDVPLKALTLNLPAQTEVYHNAKFLQVTNMGDNTPFTDPLTNAGATLGRVLFYDPRLSVNNIVSCASCHKQQYAFADNQAFSTGFQGQMTTRNTPAIINAVNKSVFFWDGRVNSLETQTLMPIKNHIEMGLEKTSVLPAKLTSISYYPALFQKAFGTTEITNEKVAMAMAQFVRSIASSEAAFDNSVLTGDALAGERLFFGKYKCGNCHRGNNFGGASIFSPYRGGGSDTSVANTVIPNTSNIGLDVNYTDQGEQALTGIASQNGFFIIPSLRNVSLTAPYMHDGRFKSLSEVIDHYSNGIAAHPNLDPILLDKNFAAGQVISTTGTPVKMNISETEKKQMIAFLNSLTDYSITTDSKFANPFK